jgi:hypothetical protein
MTPLKVGPLGQLFRTGTAVQIQILFCETEGSITLLAIPAAILVRVRAML